MTVNVDKQWFVDRWTEKGLTLRKVANLIDMDPSALSRVLSGDRKMKIPEIGKMAEVLEVSDADVLAHIQVRNDQAESHATAANVARISDHPGFGFMKGLIKFADGFDGTGPYDDEPWDQSYLGEDRR
jgi:transcriptional regulator with XRE-family HTH domain